MSSISLISGSLMGKENQLRYDVVGL